MSFTREDVESIVNAALDAHSRVHNQEIEHRITMIEAALKNHMEWEEKNGNMMREALQKQSEAINKLFTKIDDSLHHTDSCRVSLEDQIKRDYPTRVELELMLEKRNRYNVKTTDAIEKQIRANEARLKNYSIVATTAAAVVVFGGKFAEWVKSMGFLG